MEPGDELVRINIILPESKREKFFALCRHTRIGGGKTPRRLSMNAALNLLIDAVLSGSIDLSALARPPEPPAEKPREAKGRRKGKG